MGQFSWLDCKNGTQVVDNKRENVYLLIPAQFGGGHILEPCYDGYGHFCYQDVYALVARWNYPEKCNGENDHDRMIGIDIACYDKDNKRLKYPIKITHDDKAIYEDCSFSPSDPYQGWIMEDDDGDDLIETLEQE